MADNKELNDSHSCSILSRCSLFYLLYIFVFFFHLPTNRNFETSKKGHDFRSSYRKLNYLRTAFPKTPCMALTATATPKVIKDITNELSLQNCPLHIGSFDRPNIFYKVKYKDSLDNPLEELVKYVKGRHPSGGKKTSSESNKNSNTATEECSGIVYVHKREDTFMIARAISKAGISASPYHAGLKKADRAAVQEGWSSGKILVAVATVAFGMGIDRHCVRYVVHWSLPKTIEGFYQEAGRAGRDGQPSHSLLFYSPEDVGKYKYLIRMQGSKSSQHKGTAEERRAEKNTERKLEQLEEMQYYCTQMKCRRNTLIKHFGGKPVDCQKTCDHCRNPKKVERSLHASTAIKDVRRQQQSFGKQQGGGGRKGGKEKQPWNGQWDKPHGDTDENDWEDHCIMAGDLRVTGPLGADPEDYTTSASRSSNSCTGRTGDFAKASDILSKYESMEGRYGGSNNYGDDDLPRKQTRSINIPEHLKASLKAASDFTTANNILPSKKRTTAKPLTSTDHANKAKEIAERLNKIKAEREKRLKALQAKTSKKPPPPPPAPLSFSRR
jgi:RecQ family ATP-dependent DNA helicase